MDVKALYSGGLPDETEGLAVVVHSLAQARAAIAAAARAGRALVLLSAAGAGAFAGPAWWRALIAACGFTGKDILDCGEDGAAALEALRLGQRALVIAGPFAASVADAARAIGAATPTRPPGLDLGLLFSEAAIDHALARYFSAAPPASP